MVRELGQSKNATPLFVGASQRPKEWVRSCPGVLCFDHRALPKITRN